jgi:hypothetical protein
MSLALRCTYWVDDAGSIHAMMQPKTLLPPATESPAFWKSLGVDSIEEFSSLDKLEARVVSTDENLSICEESIRMCVVLRRWSINATSRGTIYIAMQALLILLEPFVTVPCLIYLTPPIGSTAVSGCQT